MSTPPSAPVAPAPRSSKLLIGLVVVVTLIAAALGALLLSGRASTSHGDEAPAKVEAKPVKPIFVTLEPMTVNLRSEGRARFLHVGLVLRVRDEKGPARLGEIMPELRSRALMLLSNREPESLLAAQDKAKLAEEIIAELNRPLAAGLPAQGIDGVSFVTFVVQ